MHVAIASDHGGFQLKNELIEKLGQAGHTVVDHGVNSADSVDYPDYARLVTASVLGGQAERGILVCGTGQGMAMSANKVDGSSRGRLRSVLRGDGDGPQRRTCSLFGTTSDWGALAWLCVETWLKTEFEGGRHARRVGKISC